MTKKDRSYFNIPKETSKLQKMRRHINLNRGVFGPVDLVHNPDVNDIVRISVRHFDATITDGDRHD